MKRKRSPKAMLFGTASSLALSTLAMAQAIVTIPAENLKTALDDYIKQSHVQLIYNVDDVTGLRSHDVHGLPPDAALAQLLLGTGVFANRDRSGAIIISRRSGRRSDNDDSGPLYQETVVVTGSRIARREDTPTPVTAVSAKQLASAAPSNMLDGLNKLPIFMQGSTPNNATTGANGRGYNAPGYFLNLRGLGAIRTLILEDGHRVPATFYDTTVDADMLPQMLISRVEVVTGGASAVYGSDAVTGVVNFILDRKFEGLKSVLQGGISDYGDVKSIRAGMAGGVNIGARGHLIWSAEFYNRAGIPDDAARPYGLLGTSIVGAGTAASPYTLVFGIRQSNVAPGGLALSGPFSGQQFLNNGQLAPFNPGTPTATANFSISGDGGVAHDEYLLPAEQTAQGFAHLDWNFYGDLSGYLEARYATARSYEAGQIFTNTAGQYPITIYSGNAFLDSSAQAMLTANGTPSFQMSRMDNDLMSRLGITQITDALAMTAGLQGRTFANFTWDAYYTHGESRTEVTTRNNVNTARFFAAIDVVHDPATGNTVCAVSLTAPGAFPGCVPLDLFGQGNASQAAMNYVGGTTWNMAHNTLDDFSANITGTAFDGWAGPVKLALGTEYRLASLNVSTSTPDNSFNPQYLRLGPYPTAPSPDPTSPWGPNCAGPINVIVPLVCEPLGPKNTLGPVNPQTGQPTALPSAYPAANLAWFKEVQSGAHGSENIGEANIEVDIPIIKEVPFIQLFSLNGAYRYTQYSTAGNRTNASQFAANTWKLGMTWRVFDDLDFRATRSRDIRAPTLWDLYQQQVITTSGVSDPLTGVSGSANTLAGGNPELKPEVFRNTTAGAIFTPGWLPHFSMTIDYFHVASNNAIGAVAGNNPTVQALCLASDGSSPYCALLARPISYNSTSPQNFYTLNISLNQNTASMYAEGIDLDMNYATDLAGWSGVDGIVHLRTLWTHQPVLKSQALPGAVITNAAGTAAAPLAGTPVDKVTVMLDYQLRDFTINILERFDSAIHQNANPTLIFNIPDVRAYFQTDLNLSYDFVASGQPVTAFFNINNLFNVQGGILQVPGYTGSPGLNYPIAPYADLIGRYFTMGLRLEMN